MPMRRPVHAERSTLMTEGPIARQLIAFALPLFLGNLFQQLYNTADSLIVGNFLGSEALAAVSSSSNLIQLMIGFFNGLAVGAGVVISRYYGARDIPRIQKAIHTMLAGGVIAGALLTALGVTLTPILLRMMGTPEAVLPLSVAYFRTYFYGAMAFVLYNICMGILQAVGDSRHPLYYLIVSSVVNVTLDLLFIGVFHWGVASAAAATAISQLVSAMLSLYRLMHSDRDYRVNLRKIRINPGALREILKNGIPSGFANCIIAIANVVIQSNINVFGAAAMAGCGAAARIDGFAFLPITCFNMALTTFVGQNLGAQRYDRVRRGVRIGVMTAVVIAQLIGLVNFILSPHLIALFDKSPEVIRYGMIHERTMTAFYCLLAYSHTMAAVFRGAGKSTVAMLGMAVCWCVVRVPYVTIATRIYPHLIAVSSAYPVTWTLSSIIFTLYYLKSDWMHGYSHARA